MIGNLFKRALVALVEAEQRAADNLCGADAEECDARALAAHEMILAIDRADADGARSMARVFHVSYFSGIEGYEAQVRIGTATRPPTIAEVLAAVVAAERLAHDRSDGRGDRLKIEPARITTTIGGALLVVIPFDTRECT